MTKLPDHRRILHGRTWGRSWSPEDYDPIQVYRSPTSAAEKAAGYVIAVVIGVLGAAALANWWAA